MLPLARMLAPSQAQVLFERALVELAPDWSVTAPCEELALHHPDHWPSGIGTFGFTLHHRAAEPAKVLGRRSGGGSGATYHRGVSYRVLEAYADGVRDPIRRYLEEIGALTEPRRSARSFVLASAHR